MGQEWFTMNSFYKQAPNFSFFIYIAKTLNAGYLMRLKAIILWESLCLIKNG